MGIAWKMSETRARGMLCLDCLDHTVIIFVIIAVIIDGVSVLSLLLLCATIVSLVLLLIVLVEIGNLTYQVPQNYTLPRSYGIFLKSWIYAEVEPGFDQCPLLSHRHIHWEVELPKMTGHEPPMPMQPKDYCVIGCRLSRSSHLEMTLSDARMTDNGKVATVLPSTVIVVVWRLVHCAD